MMNYPSAWAGCRVWLTFGSLALLARASLLAERPAEEDYRLPNIVFVFADDLGWGDLGCYGHPYAKTPAIDRLAKEGTRFTQAYVTGVTCNPSRTGLMTGLWPARFAKYAADFGFGDRVTITELLKKRGYKTGHFGKWHMGPKQSNGTYGIDTVKVIGRSRDDSGGRDDDLFTAAIDFIKSNKDTPFYVNIWGHATHYPVNIPDRLANKFDDVTVERKDFAPTMQHKFDKCKEIGGDLDQSMRQYLGDVHQIDLNVERVLKTIDELELKHDTIVVFSSDHGPAPVVTSKGPREYSPNMLGYAGPYRGGKHEQYEGGVRVPLIIRWPAHVKAGRVDTSNVFSFIDWMPTLCAIAGIDDLPDQLDGEDLSDVWFGALRKRQNPLFWRTSSTGSTPAIRDESWKLHLRRRRKGIELYDLKADPSESENVANQHPEVVARLRGLLGEWMGELPGRYEKKGGAKKASERKPARIGRRIACRGLSRVDLKQEM